MEKELNYLSQKIEILESKISTIEDVQSNYTTSLEKSFYDGLLGDYKSEKRILENMLNYISINELTKPV